MCFRSIRQNTDSQAFLYSYLSGLSDRTQCNLPMNWAEANVLVPLIEGKGVKIHLPAPFDCPKAAAMGVLVGMVAEPRAHMLGDIHLLCYKSRVAGAAPERTWGKEGEET